MITQSAWDAVGAPLLAAAGPRSVWIPGGADLADVIGKAVTAVSDAGDADAAIIGAEPNNAAVAAALAACAEAPTIDLVLVFGVGWPHGDRDGFLQAAPTRPAQRRLPDPTTGALGPEHAGLEYALESGGTDNGVGVAVERFASEQSSVWQVVRIDGLGGAAVATRGTPATALRRELETFAAGTSARRIALRLDHELGAARVRAAQLGNELTRAREEIEALTYTLTSTFEQIRAANDDDERRLESVLPQALSSIERRLARSEQRERVLESRLRAAEAQAVEARTEQLSERLWVAGQMQRLMRSRSWRIGDGIVRSARRAAFRRDRGTNALGAVLKRLEPPDDAR